MRQLVDEISCGNMMTSSLCPQLLCHSPSLFLCPEYTPNTCHETALPASSFRRETGRRSSVLPLAQLRLPLACVPRSQEIEADIGKANLKFLVPWARQMERGKWQPHETANSKQN